MNLHDSKQHLDPSWGAKHVGDTGGGDAVFRDERGMFILVDAPCYTVERITYEDEFEALKKK